MQHNQQYNHFTCHTDMTDSYVHVKSTIDTPSDLHKMDTNRKLQKMSMESIESLKEEIQEEKEYLILQNQIRQKLAQQLSFDFLLKQIVEMDDNLNPIHNIFIWILSVFYRANKNEYDWIGFKQSFIIDDQGNDLKNRIGLMNMVRLTKLEFEQTKHLIQIRKVIDDKIKNNKILLQLISQLYDLIHIIIKTYESGQKVFRIEEEIMKRDIEEEQQIHE